MKNAFDFKTLVEFLDYYKDEATCVAEFTKMRFRDGEYCPHCGHSKIHLFANGKRYRCAKCKQDFTIRTKSVFGESKLPLKKWFIAIYLLTISSKGMSSVQIAKHVGVTQPTAWFMCHRIRSVKTQGGKQLSGTIEVDETYVGGKEKNKHFSKRTAGARGRSTKAKMPVLGLIERGGEIRARERLTRESDSTKVAALMIYLNKTCFNGLYRVNKAGGFNVPIGDYKDTVLFDEDVLRADSRALQGVTITQHEFAQMPVAREDFYYLDPPYHKTFDGYNGNGFADSEHEKLAAFCREIHAAKAYFMLSNSDTPFVRSLYKGFTIEQISASRSVSCKADQRKKENELVIRNY